ncbi:uncharacterized protein LOC133801403 [Humulus lupulus]|uniref:uncharacterized protein LOC133801403 n=1 Tax=Humulus lupulus TaxID=3486 RepID=UPI002B40BA0C|nr:uncharacterized protein LOC133801403 [Humulus lupulus]
MDSHMSLEDIIIAECIDDHDDKYFKAFMDVGSSRQGRKRAKRAHVDRGHVEDDSYGQGLLVLEQSLSTQPSEGQASDGDDSRGMVFMAMSTLLSERGNFDEAIEKLQGIQDMQSSSMGLRVAAMEALVGLYLELGQDDTSSVVADKCLDILGENGTQFASGVSEVLSARAKAAKGLNELVCGNIQSAESFFQVPEDSKGLTVGATLSRGEFLHTIQNFSLAKELYQNVIQQLSESKDCNNSNSLAACNMSLEEVLLSATCALGQLEAQLGNFGHAEEILTKALTNAEEQFGSHHPKVGVVLTCIALMFRRKAIQENSSSLLIQEGLYRRAIELLKAPALETEGAEAKVARSDIMALARGGYAEAISVQQNRKDQGEKMKSWAEAAWRNRRLSLAEALEMSEPSSKTLVIDTRISRAL